MVIFSAWCAYGMLTTVKDIPMFSEDCNVAFRNPYFNKIVYWFFMSKYVEFADTLFLIVKNKEVSWLHYHRTPLPTSSMGSNPVLDPPSSDDAPASVAPFFSSSSSPDFCSAYLLSSLR